MTRMGKVLLAAGIVVGILIGIVLAARFDLLATLRAELPVGLSAGTSTASPEAIPGSFVELSEKVKPSVVNISTTKTIEHPRTPFGNEDTFPGFPDDDFFKPFFPQGPMKTQSLGSGFVIDERGYIATNAHVVIQADEIQVNLLDGGTYKGKVIGTDTKTDLAVIKIEADKKLPVLKFSDSDELKVGEWVMAVGNPFGLAHTVTAGIISAKDRQIGQGPYDDFIQTDASINPGNSGGPLVNLRGEVVGVNTAINPAGQGIGFAVPANIGRHVFNELIEHGKVTRGWLGIGIQKLTEELAEQLGVKDKKGVVVSGLLEDSPAGKAGVRQGDVIVEFDGKKVETMQQLQQFVAVTPVGDKVEVVVI
ncbi:MAG: trypsin-like peptidase domain-containing protein, partial [bacterium]